MIPKTKKTPKIVPNKIDSLPKISKQILLNNKSYFLSVVGDDINNTKFHFGENLTIKN